MTGLVSLNHTALSPPSLTAMETTPLKKDRLVQGMGWLCTRVINHPVSLASFTPSIFYLDPPPSMHIQDYIFRIANSGCSEELLVMATIYMSRFEEKSKQLINAHNVHKLFLSAIRIANKFNDDTAFPGNQFALIAGVTRNELNDLEAHFLYYISFNAFIENSEYEKTEKALINLLKSPPRLYTQTTSKVGQ